MLGRVADVVVLSEDERRFLEEQVRRHKAPRSLSDRYRGLVSQFAISLYPAQPAPCGRHETLANVGRPRLVILLRAATPSLASVL